MIVCRNCGKQIDINSEFCENCGAKLDLDEVIYKKDIENTRLLRNRRDNIRFACNILLTFLLLIGIMFTFLSFFLTEYPKITMVILALVVYLIFFIVLIVKTKKLSNIEKKLP